METTSHRAGLSDFVQCKESSLTLWFVRFFPPQSRVKVFTCVGWFVGRITRKLLTGFPQNLDGGQATITNWCGSGKRDGFRNFFSLFQQRKLFFYIFVIFSESNIHILIEKNQAYLGSWYLSEHLRGRLGLGGSMRSTGCHSRSDSLLKY